MDPEWQYQIPNDSRHLCLRYCKRVFFYLSFAITSKNDISLEIKLGTSFVNRLYYGLSTQVSSRDLFRSTKLMFLQSLILLVFLYDVEAYIYIWVYESKILSAFFGPFSVSFRRNKELYGLLNDIDVVQRITIQRFLWPVNVVRMKKDVLARLIIG